MNELNTNLQKYGDGYKLLKFKFYEKRTLFTIVLTDLNK